jgi:RNA polymerase sigma-70 factor (ECF subfamily)
MPVVRDADTERLLAAAAAGDSAARGLLFARHRDRLRRAVGRRLDRRLAARVDPSDVVQETLADANRKLPDYLDRRPLPFYPWLRRLALERIIRLHRRHVRAGKRSVTREQPGTAAIPPAAADGPPTACVRNEVCRRVRTALDRLTAVDREVLVLRHFEQLPVRDVAERLGLTEGAVKVRHLRALRRLTDQLTADEGPLE